MKVRQIVTGVALGAVLVLAFGVGVASGQSADGDGSFPGWSAMDAMHDSPLMERLREQMGPELAAQCEEMHAQMQEQGGMMGSDGMMGGAGMMSGASLHDEHHPATGADGPREAGWDGWRDRRTVLFWAVIPGSLRTCASIGSGAAWAGHDG
jgi:hypothetical protein